MADTSSHAAARRRSRAPQATATSAAAAKPRPPRVVSHYQLGKTLGQGSMGKVKVATCIDTAQQFACKIVHRPVRDPASTDTPTTILAGPANFVSSIPGSERIGLRPLSKAEQDDQRIIREIAITLLLSHPNIVPLKEVVVTNDFYYLFFEYIDGPQMLDFIISHGRLKEKFARRFMRQVVSAVDYCHQNSIVHRDLKIENILIDKRGQIKLIDFGLANTYNPSALLSTFCGSLYFAAPELLSAKKYIGPEVDVWSMGVILYVLVCGKVPFDDTSLPALHAKIKAGVVDYPSFLTDECAHLLSRMLVLNPAHRATVQEIKNHPWITKDHDGPPKNYLPERGPIALPLDETVVEQMCGFEFGDVDDIRDKIMYAVSHPPVSGPLDAMHPLVHNKMVQGPPHAILSVYMLLKERMDFERAQRYSSEIARVPDAMGGVVPGTPTSARGVASGSHHGQVPLISTNVSPVSMTVPDAFNRQHSAPLQPTHKHLDRHAVHMTTPPRSVVPAQEAVQLSPTTPVSVTHARVAHAAVPSPRGSPKDEASGRRTHALTIRIQGDMPTRSHGPDSAITPTSSLFSPVSPSAYASSDGRTPTSAEVPDTDIAWRGASQQPQPDEASKAYDHATSVFGTISRRQNRKDVSDKSRRSVSKERKQDGQLESAVVPAVVVSVATEHAPTSSTESSSSGCDTASTLQRSEPKGVFNALFASMTRVRRKGASNSGSSSPKGGHDTGVEPRAERNTRDSLSVNMKSPIGFDTVSTWRDSGADGKTSGDGYRRESLMPGPIDTRVSMVVSEQPRSSPVSPDGRRRPMSAGFGVGFFRTRPPMPVAVEDKSSKGVSKTGHIDDKIDNVYFQGLFTVSNTSALHPSMIRRDLLRVLDLLVDEKQDMTFAEHSGVIVVDFLAPVTSNNPTLFQRRHSKLPLLSVSIGGRQSVSGAPSSSNDTSVSARDDTSAYEDFVLTPMTPVSMSASATPSSINGVSTLLTVSLAPDSPTRPSTSTSTSTPTSSTSPSASTLIPPRSVSKPTQRQPNTPLQHTRFEIKLCKITWRGLYGIQFHRVGGDSWMYKQMCQSILEQLRI